jgi:hypothetical protein
VARLNPRAFLIENVPGLVYWQNGHMGDKILKEFDALNYRRWMFLCSSTRTRSLRRSTPSRSAWPDSGCVSDRELWDASRACSRHFGRCRVGCCRGSTGARANARYFRA